MCRTMGAVTTGIVTPWLMTVETGGRVWEAVKSRKEQLLILLSTSEILAS